MNNLSILQYYTDTLRDTRTEREKLQSLAMKIKKFPDSINIPNEYLVKREKRTRKHDGH